MIVPVAHAGHWLADLALVAPVFIAVLVVLLRERFVRRRERDSDGD